MVDTQVRLYGVGRVEFRSGRETQDQFGQENDRPTNDIDAVRELLASIDGVDQVLEGTHPRAGELVAVAAPGCWFSYDYWLDDSRAPDFARTVDIHRKPGYDPLELFLDPLIRHPRLKIGWRLAQKKLGLRALLDVMWTRAFVLGAGRAEEVLVSRAPTRSRSPPPLSSRSRAESSDAGRWRRRVDRTCYRERLRRA